MSESQKDRMLTGKLYNALDGELQADQLRAARWMQRYNAAVSVSAEDRLVLLREIVAHAGDGVVIRPPFYCDYGANIHLGDGVYLNFNCIVLDVMPVHIGAGPLIGPNVQILTADHPRDAQVRASGLELGRAVVIGRNVWIGGGAIILPGVTVGDDAIIGAGSVVTRDVPAGSTVAGNPARRI